MGNKGEKVGLFTTYKQKKEAERLIKENSFEGEKFRKLLVTCAKLQGLDTETGKREIKYQKEILQDAKMYLASKQEAEAIEAKYQADLKNRHDQICNAFQTKLNRCYEQINGLREQYEAELSQKCELMTAEFNELEKLIGNEPAPEKRAQLQDQLKAGRANLREAQRGAVIDLDNAAYREPSDFANPLQGIENAISRLRHAKPSKDFEKSPDFQEVSKFFEEIENNTGKLNELFNSTVSKTEEASQSAETSLSELKQYAQSLPQAKLDRFKAKQEEWNKKFDEICAHHEAALKAFETLDDGDSDFRKALKEKYDELETYKTETRQEFALVVEKTIKEYEGQLEQLKSGDSGSIQDIAKFRKDMDRDINWLSQRAPQGRDEKQSLSRLRDSASIASMGQLNAFNAAIETNVEKANAEHAQHVQTEECFKEAIDNLPDGQKLPDNAKNFYDAFVKAANDLQAGIKATSNQFKTVADTFNNAVSTFSQADVASDREAIQKFTEAHKQFKSDSARVQSNSANIELLQQACIDKLNALETELLKTPEGCRILIDRDKAQIDRSIGYTATFAKTLTAFEHLGKGDLKSTENQKLWGNLGQLQGRIEQSKQKITQVYTDNIASLDTTNKNFAQNYEAFHRVCQEIKETLDN